MKAIGLFLLTFALSLTTLGIATHGFRVATAEGARRLAVENNPVPIPDVVFENMRGENVALSDYRGQQILIEFIFTSCPTICQVMGENFAKIQTRITSRPDLQSVRMLSISFDIKNDTPEALKEYSERYGARENIWKIVRPRNQQDLHKLLDLFGVKIIPDPDFGFQHNVAVHVVDRVGRLVRIIDLEPDEAIKAITGRTKKS